MTETFDDLRDLYQEVILDHGRRPRHGRRLDVTVLPVVSTGDTIDNAKFPNARARSDRKHHPWLAIYSLVSWPLLCVRRTARQSSRLTRSMRSCFSCASTVIVAIGRASRRARLIGSPLTSQ